MYCSQCGYKLEDSGIYCESCGKPTASFNYTGENAARVQPIDELETFVRSRTLIDSPSKAKSNETTKAIIISLTLLTSFGIAAFLYTSYLEHTVKQNEILRKQTESVAANANAEAARIESERAANAERRKAEQEEKAAAKRARQEAEHSAREKEVVSAPRDYSIPAYAPNAAANSNRIVANTASWPPPFDSRGRRLRAICNDGSLSYYQGDQTFVCLLKGGPRVLYW